MIKKRVKKPNVNVRVKLVNVTEHQIVIDIEKKMIKKGPHNYYE